MDLAESLELEFESLIKQTEKAFQIKFNSETVCWLPKSQVRIMDDYIYIPKWLVEDKQLKEFVIK